MTAILSPSLLAQLDESIASAGYSVFTDFLASDFVSAVNAEIEVLQKAGQFQAANIGKGSATHHAPETRGDGTYWIEPDLESAPQVELARLLNSVREHLNEKLFLGLWDWEGHYAIYPKGAFYRKHLDRFASDSRRTISLVFFFNPDWKVEDGGALRLHLPSGPRDVLPRAGTAVFFRSDQIPHEVLETNRDRFSFAGWFRTRP
jgi:SM-20-related protein